MALCNSKSPTHFRIQQSQPLLFLRLTIFVFVPFPFADSTYFYYTTFQPNDPKILYQGDAFATNEAIELTNALEMDSFKRVGRASYADPIHQWDSKTGNMTEFKTFFRFNITRTNKTYLGDGLTFFLSPYNASIPINPLDGLLGLFNSTALGNTNNQIVAVEFDTKQDSWDPCPYHIGIDVNSIESAAYTKLDDRLANGTTADAWVNYDPTTTTLRVWLSFDGGKSFDKLFYYNIDLRNFLPEWVRIGFSASLATSSTERHTVTTWLFNSDYSMLEDSSNSTLGPWPSPSDSASGASPSNSASGGSPSMITGHKTKSRLGVYVPVGIIGSLILVALFCFTIWRIRNPGTNANAGGGAKGKNHVEGNAAVEGDNNQLNCVNNIQNINNTINYNGHPPKETRVEETCILEKLVA
ncbi:hypothetical protein Vadar_026247 [Vaccinium darrowii]|uniref:Uncharacterized protein n=1 Tax=Vaccinium darrowii TaxID=229202 RepID=A0ACB7ZMP9_9ERIC|nr:hypothetical protein Vadar_026247 [Vaccinium darrowii]